MTEVTPIPKPERKPKRNGHEYRCPCASCRGSRNRRKGQEAQRRVARAMGAQPRFRGALANEETWNLDGWCNETKSGAQVPSLLVKAFNQARGAKAIGDTRRVVVTLVPPGVTASASPEHCLAVLSLKDFLEAVQNVSGENSWAVREKIRSAQKLLKEAEELAR